MIDQLPAEAEWSLMDPWFLVTVPGVWALFVWRVWRPSAALSTASTSTLAGLPKTARARLVWLPVALQALALTALAVALSRPVSRGVMPLRDKGVDIVLVMDISSSMTESDMDDVGRLTRIEVSRESALAFAAARVHDRVGLLTFARFPELCCPLTLDQDALAAFLRTVETVPERSPENMTGIGIALAKATTLLEDSDAKSKVIVLLSDGENNVPDITPEDAAKLAKDAGIRVHCIGVGRGRIIRDRGYRRPRQIAPKFSSLQAIARIAEGEFHDAKSGAELTRVYDRIDEMERVEMEDPRFRTVEWYLYPFVVGVALFVFQLLLEFLWIRRLP